MCMSLLLSNEEQDVLLCGHTWQVRINAEFFAFSHRSEETGL